MTDRTQDVHGNPIKKDNNKNNVQLKASEALALANSHLNKRDLKWHLNCIFRKIKGAAQEGRWSIVVFDLPLKFPCGDQVRHLMAYLRRSGYDVSYYDVEAEVNIAKVSIVISWKGEKK